MVSACGGLSTGVITVGEERTESWCAMGVVALGVIDGAIVAGRLLGVSSQCPRLTCVRESATARGVGRAGRDAGLEAAQDCYCGLLMWNIRRSTSDIK